MSFKRTDADLLAHEKERVKGVLSVHMKKGQEYSVEELLDLLAQYGLEYSESEYKEIGKALVTEKFIESV